MTSGDQYNNLIIYKVSEFYDCGLENNVGIILMLHTVIIQVVRTLSQYTQQLLLPYSEYISRVQNLRSEQNQLQK